MTTSQSIPVAQRAAVVDAEDEEAGGDTPAPVPPPYSRARHLREQVLVSLFVSVIAVYLLNESTFIGRKDSAYVTVSHAWLAGIGVDGIWSSTLYVWVLLIALWALAGRLWIGVAVLLDVVLVLGAVNAIKLRYRGEPIYPSDADFLRTPDFLAQMVSPATWAAAAAAVVLLPVAVGVLARLLGRPRAEEAEPRAGWRRWRPLLLRALVVLLGVASVVHTASFNQPGNVWRAVFDADISRWVSFSQHESFVKNGFVPAVLANMPVDPMVEPDGYSLERMDEIVTRYQRLAASTNAGRPAGAWDDANVVVVLSEAFSDPTALLGPDALDEDPIPEIRALSKETTSGELRVDTIGGGTANVEFEALTGLSMGLFAPQIATPYQQVVPRSADFPSLVRWFGEHGHDTVAVHPFSPEMYRRNDVYPKLGFQEFLSQGDLADADDDKGHDDGGTFVSDRTAYAAVTDQIAQHRRPLFAHLVTMQNHLPYEDEYDDPIGVQAPGAEVPGLGQYARGLAITDAATKEFLDGLSRSGEPTVVLFFGDHLPGIYPASMAVEAGSAMYETPYFVWSTFDETPQAGPGAISANQLLRVMFDAAGAPEPALISLLSRLPADLSTSRPQDDRKLTPSEQQALEDYRLVQYDWVMGGRWSAPGLLGP